MAATVPCCACWGPRRPASWRQRELAGRVGTAGELARRDAERRRDAFRTGVEPLDRLLDGGLPRGALVELVGRSGSGRFATALATLAAATGAGEAAVLIDLGDHLDPQAAHDLGIDAERLLWLRPRHVQEALAAAEAVLHGGFPLVVIDLGTPPVPGGRGNEASWVRLARAAETHGAALLVASPYRVSGTAARAVVEARPARALYAAAARGATPLLAGIGVHLTLEKSRGRSGGDEAAAQLVLPGAAPPAVDAAPQRPGRTAAPRRPARRAPRTAGGTASAADAAGTAGAPGSVAGAADGRRSEPVATERPTVSPRRPRRQDDRRLHVMPPAATDAGTAGETAAASA